MKTLYVKNMVCQRCIMAVETLLNQVNLPAKDVRLGEVHLVDPISKEEKAQLELGLSQLGFELIDQKKNRIIEQMKQVIIKLVHQDNNELKTNLSQLLSENLLKDYASLSQLFSQVEGTTIEKYYVAQKMERVKELLVYNELSLTEIAFMLNYSSVAYLSNQFKQVTGLRPSHFKKIGRDKRKPLDQV